MKSLIKYAIFCSLVIPSVTFGQQIITDSTRASSFISYCNDRNKVEKPIYLEWVQIDKDVIREKLNKLPFSGSTVTGIKSIVPQFLDGKCNCQSVTEELGYGLKSTKHTIYGGYGSYNVDAIYFGDNIIKLRLTISNHREIIEKHLLDVIRLPFICLNGQVCYEKVYPENLRKYLAGSGELFISSQDTNLQRQQAINYFTDVMTGGTFTEPYYVTFGLGSETFNNLRYFIVNKDYDALTSILFSPSPTSRLFAARTLLYMQGKAGYRPDSKINERIKETIAKAKPIRSGILSCWINKFDYDYYDVVNDFEKLLITQ
ncbi:MAG: hypothetical protein ACRYFX_03745 [Janthinobacterium lividum]